MPAEKTRADSLREYLTGAASDGGTQTAPNSSLGNFRSSTEAASLGISVASPISNITIQFAGGGNTAGVGSLLAVDANTLQWKCAGGSYGANVPIANGETKIVETLGVPGAFLRVTRTSAAALSGTASVTLTPIVNNVFAFDDLSSAEASAGDTEYRSTIVVNESAATVVGLKRYIGTLGTQAVSDGGQLSSSGAGTITTTGSFADWPETGFAHIRNGSSTREIVYYSQRTSTVLTIPSTGRGLLGTSAAAGANTDTVDAVPGIAIAIDDDGVTAGGAAIQTISDESSAPTGVTWNTGITAATGLQIGNLTTTQQVGIWMKRVYPADSVASANVNVRLVNTFDAA